MPDLTTHYMGLQLKNPIIAGASNLSKNLDNLKMMEEAGAGAIVYKSLFEEQIQLESIQLDEELQEYNERHAEMVRLFPDVSHAGPEEFLFDLRRAREAVSIPLIASLNAIHPDTWIEYAQKLEQTGVDGLELNFYAFPKDANTPCKKILDQKIAILKAVKKTVKIPVSAKLSPYYTNILGAVQAMDQAGADGFVLFNRLFQPEIDIENETLHFPFRMSHPEDNRLSLRYTGMLYGQIKGSICASKGIYEAKDIISMILAGADAVQIVGALYKHKIPYLKTLIEEVEKWMERKGYQSLNDFKGKLSRSHLHDPFAYKRAQYVDILLNAEEIIKKNPLH